MTDDETKAARDAMIFGTGYMLDGKYVPMEAVMTDDLVKRLRKVEPDAPGERTRWYRNPDGPEAADRIEALEQALHEIASNNFLHLTWHSTAPMPMERYKDNCYEMMNIARAALGEKKDG